MPSERPPRPALRRRRVPRALQVDGARRVPRLRRRRRAASSSSRSLEGSVVRAIAHENIVRRVPLATTRGVIRDARGQGARVEPRPPTTSYVVPGRAMPSARPTAPEHAPSESRTRWPRIADIAPPEPGGARALRQSASARRLQTATRTSRPAGARPRPARPRARHRRRAAAARERARRASRSCARPCATTRSRTSARTARLRGRDRRRDARGVRPAGYDQLTRRATSRSQPARLRARATSSAPPASSTPGRATCAASAAGRSASSTRADATARAPTPSASSTTRRQEPLPGPRPPAHARHRAASRRSSRRCAHSVAGAVVVVDVRTGRHPRACTRSRTSTRTTARAATDASACARPFDGSTATRSSPSSTRPIERRLPAGLDVQALLRARRARGHKLDPGGHRAVRRVPRCSGGASSTAPTCTAAVEHAQAIAESCNVYFFKVAEAVGMDRIAEMATEFGLGAEDRARHQPRGRGPRCRPVSWYALHYRGSSASAYASTRRSARARRPSRRSSSRSPTPRSPTAARSTRPSSSARSRPRDGTVVQDFRAARAPQD